MKKSSQKLIKHVKTSCVEIHAKNCISADKYNSTVSRFYGMSKDLERVPPLHIPGYKTRG